MELRFVCFGQDAFSRLPGRKRSMLQLAIEDHYVKLNAEIKTKDQIEIIERVRAIDSGKDWL